MIRELAVVMLQLQVAGLAFDQRSNSTPGQVSAWMDGTEPGTMSHPCVGRCLSTQRKLGNKQAHRVIH